MILVIPSIHKLSFLNILLSIIFIQLMTGCNDSSNTKNTKNILTTEECFFCEWGTSSATLPVLSDSVVTTYELNKDTLNNIFQHSFNLSRTIYGNNNNGYYTSRDPNYWLMNFNITPSGDMPNGESGDIYYQMFTGGSANTMAMWARDSMWQIMPYILSAKIDLTSIDSCTSHPNTPSLRCLSRGTMLALAYFFAHDPFQTNGEEPGAYFSIYKGAATSTQTGYYPLPVIQVTGTNCTLTNNSVAQNEWLLVKQSGYAARDSAGGSASSGCDLANQIDDIAFVYDLRYEPDGMASWLLNILLYNEQYPEENILNHPWVLAAAETFITIIKIEVDHDNDSPYLNVAQFSDSAGKGATVKSFDYDDDTALLTWIGFRPSDAATTYGYNIPGNLYIATALDSLWSAYTNAGASTDIDNALLADAYVLAQKISLGVDSFGTTEVSYIDEDNTTQTMTIYAFEVNGYDSTDTQRKISIMDDANFPNLLTVPLLTKPEFFDLTIYNNTIKYLQGYYTDSYVYPDDGSFTNDYFDSSYLCNPSPSINYKGFGSTVHSATLNYVWPMAIVMDAWMLTQNGQTLDEADFWQKVQQLQGFIDAQPADDDNVVLSLPESFDTCDTTNGPTRNGDTFGWMAATYALFAREWFTPKITTYTTE